MFRTMQIEGLGPLDGTFDLLRGEQTIVGRSQVGKSSLVTALCLCLWGTDDRGRPLPVEAIHDDAGAVRVELQTFKGARFVREMSRDRKTTRELYRAGEEFPDAFKSEKDWTRTALGPIGRELKVGKRKVHAGRLVVVPFAWEELASSSGGGLELRDALDAIVGGDESLEDVVRSLMEDAGEDLWEAAPTTVKAAEEWRRNAKQRADRSEGALQASEGSLRTLEASEPSTGPDEATVERARAVLVDLQTWESFDAEAAEHSRKVEANRLGVEEWDRKWEALNPSPAFSAPELSKAREDLKPAESRVKGFGMTLAKVKGQLEAYQRPELDESRKGQLEAKLKRYEDAAGHCPECERKWAKAAKVIAELRRELEGATSEKPAHVIDLEIEVDRLELEVQAAEENQRKKLAEVERLEGEERAFLDWKRRSEALGARPEELQLDAPIAPDLDRPTPLTVTEARATLRGLDEATGAGAERDAQIGRARTAVREAQAKLDRARAEVSRGEALVDAVRRAPTERLKRSLDRLGDLGPVSIRLKENGIGVYVDGRPHWLASTGRRIFADLCLRLALRRALRMNWLPVFVDDVQSWSEGWPETTVEGRPTPVVYLQTEDRGLDIVGGRP